ncbi:nitroreductase [Mucilaginibacter frigoritolerans]|uniref:Nitroreductase n=1 Tax=Mucilaginibacter frigoritolerans TaxID=652788 RepID=A0A562TVP1_9SPHI|nr:nitroreductase [Mucilaginibacter frigoritolerans]TWI97691.1 nitroreductase [Mucilaginibacter frigoritolerans]
MDTTFSTISSIIKSRRTTKAFAMNGNKIPNGHIAALLELADWAPTHAYTEPWRFIVFENPTEFCQQHADLYKQNSMGDNFNATTYNNLVHQGDMASHVIIAAMKRSGLSKLPVFEEIAAVSCAVQNILLGATALNIASFWSTGGMANKPEFRDFFQFDVDDIIIGVLYLGHADVIATEGKRTTPLEEKIKWVK